MRYEVVFSPQAECDLEAAREWLSERDSEAAERWYHRFLDATISLETFPMRCPVKFHHAGPHRDVRRLLFGSGTAGYLIYFKIDNELVTILRIRHGARKPMAPDELG